MGRFDKLPGIDDENTTRRNVLVGSGYTIGGLAIVGAILGDPDDDDDEEENGNGDDAADTDDEPVDDDEPAADDDGVDDDADDEDPPETELSDDPELVSYRELREEWFLEDPVTFSGSGTSVTDSFDTFPGLIAFTFEHDGGGNFIVEVVHEDTGNESLLVNEIGAVGGAVAVPAERGDFVLDVEADGNWEITAGQPEPATEDVREPPAEAVSGGNQLYGPIHIDGRVTVSGVHEGDGNFIVEFVDELATDSTGAELVFNEIGDFEGETSVTLDEFWGWVDVIADPESEWSIEID